MKKFTIYLITLVMFVSLATGANAIQTKNVKEQTEINQNNAKQAKIIAEEAANNSIDKKIENLSQRYINNFRTCEPLHISQYWDVFGLKFGFKVDVNGWNGDKCSYNLTGKFEGLGKDVRELFEVPVSDEMLAKFEPIVQCDFTKDQLNIMVDAFIARSQKNEEQIKKILNNPENLYSIANQKEKLTPEEEKLIKVLTDGKTCTIPNQKELMNVFSEIMQNL